MTPEVDRPGRARTHILVHVQGRIEGKDSGFFGWANDFSGEGMRLTCEPCVDVGATIVLDFVVPLTKERITVSGEVVRRDAEAGPDGYVHGIRFLEFSEGDSQKLRNYVDWQLGDMG